MLCYLRLSSLTFAFVQGVGKATVDLMPCDKHEVSSFQRLSDFLTDIILSSTHAKDVACRGGPLEIQRVHRARRPHQAQCGNELDQLALAGSLAQAKLPSCACPATVVCVHGGTPALVALTEL